MSRRAAAGDGGPGGWTSGRQRPTSVDGFDGPPVRPTTDSPRDGSPRMACGPLFAGRPVSPHAVGGGACRGSARGATGTTRTACPSSATPADEWTVPPRVYRLPVIGRWKYSRAVSGSRAGIPSAPGPNRPPGRFPRPTERPVPTGRGRYRPPPGLSREKREELPGDSSRTTRPGKMGGHRNRARANPGNPGKGRST